MARLLILTQFYPPETGAGARRVGAMARAFSQRHQVVVQTLYPSYPRAELFRGIDLQKIDQLEPCTVRRTFTFHAYGGSLPLRALREMWMSFRLSLAVARQSADVVLVSTPSMFLAPAAWALARLRRVPMIWDLRDLTWRYGQESVDAGRLQRATLDLIEKLMVGFLRRADFVVTTAEGTMRYLRKKYGLAEGKVHTIYNGVSKEFFESFADVSEPQDRRPLVLYLGLLGHNHAMDILVDVAEIVPEMDFLIVGDGTERGLIKRKIRRKGIRNLTLRGYSVDDREVLEIYRRSDILFNHSKDRPVLNEAMIPAKFFEYMATGKPIVYAGRGFSADFLGPVGCAEVVPPECPEAVAEALRRVAGDPDRAREMGARGRDFVRRGFLREDLMASFCKVLEDRGILNG